MDLKRDGKIIEERKEERRNTFDKNGYKERV